MRGQALGIILSLQISQAAELVMSARVTARLVYSRGSTFPPQAGYFCIIVTKSLDA